MINKFKIIISTIKWKISMFFFGRTLKRNFREIGRILNNMHIKVRVIK